MLNSELCELLDIEFLATPSIDQIRIRQAIAQLKIKAQTQEKTDGTSSPEEK